jgi:hypothetical protein
MVAFSHQCTGNHAKNYAMYFCDRTQEPRSGVPPFRYMINIDMVGTFVVSEPSYLPYCNPSAFPYGAVSQNEVAGLSVGK